MLTLRAMRRAYQSTFDSRKRLGRPGRRRLRWIVIVAVAIVNACTSPAPESNLARVQSTRLQSHGGVDQILDTPGIHILLFSDVIECLSCSTDLHRWFALARLYGGDATVLLNNRPEEAATVTLARMRLSFDVISPLSKRSSRELAPAVAVFDGQIPLFVDVRMAAGSRPVALDSVSKLLETRRAKLPSAADRDAARD